MAVIIQTIEGTECIGDSLPKINSNFSELAKFVAPTFTASEIASRQSSVNTTNKEEGKIIFDITNSRLLVAAGHVDISEWYIIGSSSSVIPE